MSTSPAVSAGDLPKISIGVTTYDRPDLLRECIGSILEQSYQNFEIVIANDFIPVPVTFESLELEPDPRIRIVNHEENIGAYRNNYYLIEEAKGDWFTWLADDDLMHPKFLELAVEALRDSDALSFFCGYAAAADPKGVFPAKGESPRNITRMSGSLFLEEYSSRRIRAVGAYGIFKKEIIPAISSAPKFGTGLAVYVDTYIPVIAASLGEVSYSYDNLVFLRTHSGSQSASSSQLEEYATAQDDFMVEFRKVCEGKFDKGAFNRATYGFLWWFVQDGWHVSMRGTGGIVRQVMNFSRYFISTFPKHIPLRYSVIFFMRVGFMVVSETARRVVNLLRITPFAD